MTINRCRTSEKWLEATLRKRVEAMGGWAIKFLPSLTGLPDRIVLMPCGGIWFVELKSTGKTLRPPQRLWKQRLLNLGFRWRLIDSEETLKTFINELHEYSTTIL